MFEVLNNNIYVYWKYDFNTYMLSGGATTDINKCICGGLMLMKNNKC